MLRLRVSGQGQERTIGLAGTELRLGRSADSDVVLPDASVTHQHAAIRREREGWCIYDVSGTQQILLNHVPVTRAILRPGDRVQIGIFTLVVDEEVSAPQHGRASLPAVAPGDTFPSAVVVRPMSAFSSELGHKGESTSTERSTRRTPTGTSDFSHAWRES